MPVLDLSPLRGVEIDSDGDEQVLMLPVPVDGARTYTEPDEHVLVGERQREMLDARQGRVSSAKNAFSEARVPRIRGLDVYQKGKEWQHLPGEEGELVLGKGVVVEDVVQERPVAPQLFQVGKADEGLAPVVFVFPVHDIFESLLDLLQPLASKLLPAAVRAHLDKATHVQYTPRMD